MKREKHWKRRRRSLMLTLIVIVALIIILVVMRLAPEAKAEEDPPSFIMDPPESQEVKEEPVISEEVYLLAKIMQCEAGVNWPDWAILSIGEVVLNRVSSPYFPDTVREVLYQTQPMQYEPVHMQEWEEIVPAVRYVDLAKRLMDGERPIGDPEMIWQSLFPQGEHTIVTFYDQVLGTTTYFCK